MAKVTIAGDSFIITSSITMSDLDMVKRYRPTVLTLVDTETKDVVFKVGIGKGAVTNFGVSFGGVTNDEAKLATATITIDAEVEDKKEYVLDKLGPVLVNLETIESNIKKALEEIKLERDTISKNIKVSV